MFADDIQTLRRTLAQGTPASIGQKVVKEEDKITEKDQAFYHSGMAALFYLTTQDQTLPMQ